MSIGHVSGKIVPFIWHVMSQRQNEIPTGYENLSDQTVLYDATSQIGVAATGRKSSWSDRSGSTGTALFDHDRDTKVDD